MREKRRNRFNNKRRRLSVHGAVTAQKSRLCRRRDVESRTRRETMQCLSSRVRFRVRFRVRVRVRVKVRIRPVLRGGG